MEKDYQEKRLWLDAETHRIIKIKAAELGMTLAETIAYICNEYLRLKNNDKQ